MVPTETKAAWLSRQKGTMNSTTPQDKAEDTEEVGEAVQDVDVEEDETLGEAEATAAEAPASPEHHLIAPLTGITI